MEDRIMAIEEREPGCLEPYAAKIEGLGLRYAGGGKYTGHRMSLGQESRVRRFAETHGARFFFDDEYGTRSADYRKVFYKAYRPAFRGKYFCAYCGRLISGRTLTVDHLYPVAKVSKSVKMRKKLKKQGINGLNDPENLVPACAWCNRRKGTKTGLWVLRGKLGRSAKLWYARWTIRIVAAVSAAVYLAGYMSSPI